ncbi:MAG: glycoside hydrolase family 92 protein, partial [Tannerella sp.]|nr:glycoside hydrolase family 92 protein [Tannerella sp.]
ATIRVGKNKTFKIKAPNNSPTNIYVKSIKLNGEIYNKTYIEYKDIMKGGEIEFEMVEKL